MLRTIFAAMVAAALIAAPVPVVTSTATAQTSKTKTTAKKPPSPGQIAARERQKKCGAEWKAAKAAGKIEKGMTWPKYWSACNKRLKAGG